MYRAAVPLAFVLLCSRTVLAGENFDSDFKYCGADVMNRVVVGMTVPEILAECPRPNDRSQVVTENGVREKWLYRTDSSVGTVYFHDGLVTSVEIGEK